MAVFRVRLTCIVLGQLDGGQYLDLSPVTLNLINPHVGDAGLPESKRYGASVETSITRPRMNGARPTIVTTSSGRCRG